MESEKEMFEYELIDICMDSEYEEADENNRWSACEETADEKTASDIVYDADGIPIGDSQEERQVRRNKIHEFIQQWREQHLDNPCVFNENLKEFIRINQTFLIESVSHAVGNYKSTKAVLRMEEIMTKAEYIGVSQKKEGDSNQKSFEKMIVMIYKSEELGNVKMTVGVKNRTHEKIEYSITVPTPHTPFLDNDMRLKGCSKKRKKRSK